MHGGEQVLDHESLAVCLAFEQFTWAEHFLLNYTGSITDRFLVCDYHSKQRGTLITLL
jgi:hypothetical protein